MILVIIKVKIIVRLIENTVMMDLEMVQKVIPKKFFTKSYSQRVRNKEFVTKSSSQRVLHKELFTVSSQFTTISYGFEEFLTIPNNLEQCQAVPNNV